MLIDPRLLLTYKRWDIVAKYVYIKYFDLYLKMYADKLNLELNIENDLELGFNYLEIKELEFFRNLYMDHIKLLNGAYEAKTLFQINEKNSLDEFLNDYHKLYFSILNDGFSKTSIIHITKNNSILNGAHRIAIANLFNIQIPINIYNYSNIIEFLPQAFEDREKYKNNLPNLKENTTININNLTMNQQDFLLQEYVLTKSKKLSFLVIYNYNNYIKHQDYIDTYLNERSYQIVYHKKIVLNNLGALNFIRFLYHNELHVNMMLKFANSYQSDIPCNFTTSILLLEKDDGNFKLLSDNEKKALHKKELRTYLKSSDSIHVSDNNSETIRIANLIFHQPSLDILNKLPFMIPIDITNQFKKFYYENKNKNATHYILIYNLLQELQNNNNNLQNNNNNLQNIEYICNEIKINHKNININDKITIQNLFEIIYNPNNYFYFINYKIINQSLLKIYR